MAGLGSRYSFIWRSQDHVSGGTDWDVFTVGTNWSERRGDLRPAIQVYRQHRQQVESGDYAHLGE
jgi:hypothetical protein